MVANTAGGSREMGDLRVHLVWRHLLAVRRLMKVQKLKVSLVVFETVLPCRVCPALVNQGEASARFLAALQGLARVSHRDHHAAAGKLESPTQIGYRNLPIPSMLVIHTKANLSFLVLGILLFSDQEMQPFADQDMDMGFARHCLVLIAGVAGDRRGTEETVPDNDQIQKYQQCG